MKSSPNSQWQPLQIKPKLSRRRNDRGDGPVASTPRRRGWSRWAFGRVVLNARRVPELVQEVVVIVAADQVVRNRHADGRRHRKGGIGPWREPFESMSHQRYHPRQSLDDAGRFDVDHSQSGVGLLVRDDHAQRRVEPFAFRKVGGRLGNGALVVLPLPHHEGVEQLPSSRRTIGRASDAKPRPAVRPRRGSASSCRCGRAPRRWQPVSALATTGRPRLTLPPPS